MEIKYLREEYYENYINIEFNDTNLDECDWIVEDYHWDEFVLTSDDDYAIEWAKSLGCTVENGNEVDHMFNDLEGSVILRDIYGNTHVQITFNAMEFNDDAELCDSYVRYEIY